MLILLCESASAPFLARRFPSLRFLRGGLLVLRRAIAGLDRVGLTHVGAGLGMAVIAGAGEVIDLRLGIGPYHLIARAVAARLGLAGELPGGKRARGRFGRDAGAAGGRRIRRLRPWWLSGAAEAALHEAAAGIARELLCLGGCRTALLRMSLLRGRLLCLRRGQGEQRAQHRGNTDGQKSLWHERPPLSPENARNLGGRGCRYPLQAASPLIRSLR